MTTPTAAADFAELITMLETALHAWGAADLDFSDDPDIIAAYTERLAQIKRRFDAPVEWTDEAREAFDRQNGYDALAADIAAADLAPVPPKNLDRLLSQLPGFSYLNINICHEEDREDWTLEIEINGYYHVSYVPFGEAHKTLIDGIADLIKTAEFR